MSIDWQLDADGDLKFGNYRDYRVIDIDALVQKVAIRLRRFLGEWFTDITLGVPYFQKILQKGTTFNDISASIKREILLTKMDNVLAIKKIISFEIKNSEIEQRKIIITFSAQTIYGDIFNKIVNLEI